MTSNAVVFLILVLVRNVIFALDCYTVY